MPYATVKWAWASLKPGTTEPDPRIDHPRFGPDTATDFLPSARGDDLLPAHRQSLGPGLREVRGEDTAADHQVVRSLSSGLEDDEDERSEHGVGVGYGGGTSPVSGFSPGLGSIRTIRKPFLV